MEWQYQNSKATTTTMTARRAVVLSFNRLFVLSYLYNHICTYVLNDLVIVNIWTAIENPLSICISKHNKLSKCIMLKGNYGSKFCFYINEHKIQKMKFEWWAYLPDYRLIITIHSHIESHNCNHIKYYLPYISVSYYVRILMHFLNEDFPHVTNKITWITAKLCSLKALIRCHWV